MKKMLTLALAAVVMAGGIATAPASAYTDSSLGSKNIGKIGNTTKTVSKGSDFELEVRKGRNVRDNNIKWSIGNTSVVRFDDDDRYDDEIELRAVGKGTTKVTATNLLTGGKIVYTIKVTTPMKTITRVGAEARTVRVGNEFELEVAKRGGIQDKDLYWYTSNKNIVKVVDDDRTDEEIELRAMGIGTAKISCHNRITGGKIVYTVTVKKASPLIARVGAVTKVVEVGDDIEISVRKSALTEKQIKWTISDTSKLRFEDGDNLGSEVELEARKTGTVKVTAKNLVTGGSIVYNVKIVPDYDD